MANFNDLLLKNIAIKIAYSLANEAIHQFINPPSKAQCAKEIENEEKQDDINAMIEISNLLLTDIESILSEPEINLCKPLALKPISTIYYDKDYNHFNL